MRRKPVTPGVYHGPMGAYGIVTRKTSQPTKPVYKPSVPSKPLEDQSKPEPIPGGTEGPNASVPPRKARPGSI